VGRFIWEDERIKEYTWFLETQQKPPKYKFWSYFGIYFELLAMDVKSRMWT